MTAYLGTKQFWDRFENARDLDGWTASNLGSQWFWRGYTEARHTYRVLQWAEVLHDKVSVDWRVLECLQHGAYRAWCAEHLPLQR